MRATAVPCEFVGVPGGCSSAQRLLSRDGADNGTQVLQAEERDAIRGARSFTQGHLDANHCTGPAHATDLLHDCRNVVGVLERM